MEFDEAFVQFTESVAYESRIFADVRIHDSGWVEATAEEEDEPVNRVYAPHLIETITE